MRITSIRQQKKNSERVSVFLDGKYAFGLDSKFLIDFDLYKGKKLEESKIGEIVRKDMGEKIKSRVLNLIARRPRSEKEIRDYISQKFYEGKFDLEKKFQESVVYDVLNYLKHYEYIDDRAFAKWFVQNRKEFKPRGKGLLKSELMRKGISSEIISDVLDFEKSEELKMAKVIATKKLKTLSRYDKRQKEEKLTVFLQRKGFDWDIIREVINL